MPSSVTYYGLGAHLTYVESHYTEQQIQTFLKVREVPLTGWSNKKQN